MNCSEVQERLSAYYDGELADEIRSNLDEHLGGCSECARELAVFEKLSTMAGALSTPLPPQQMWSRLEQQIDQQQIDQQQIAKPVGRSRSRSSFVPRLFALAAIVLVAVGIGYLTYPSWFTHGQHDQFAVEFRHYLDTFRDDPDAAQQMLLAKYANQLVGPDQAMKQIGYRPAVADGLPAGYTLESTHVMRMPCCTCVQSICKRSDGSTLAIFEHDDESCREKHCCLVELDDQIAASWKRGVRHITLIGVRDVAEVSQMVAWLDEKKQPEPN
jgi:hypothetical protein